jgi:hypothetical protein
MAPQILIESLESVRRRVRVLTFFFGVGIVATASVVLLLATLLTDYLLNLQALPRLVLIALALTGFGYALWHWVIKSILARLTLTDVAGRVEKTYPQYQDRLRSAINILTGNPMPGSEIMKQRVVSETTRLTQSLDLTRVVVTRPVWYSGGTGAAAMLLLALLITAAGPQYRRIALDRLITPFRAVEWPKSVNIQMVGTVPARVSVGQRIEVNIRLTRGDKAGRQAIIHYRYADAAGNLGPEEQEIMTRGEDGIYHASLDARTIADAKTGDAMTGAVQFFVKAGDDQMDVKPVMVVQRLTISHVDAVITAPPYAKLPPTRVNLTQNPAVLTLGSKVQLIAAFNKPLDPNHPVTVELLTDKAKPVFKWAAPVGNAITATVDATESFRFHLHATDLDGLSNTGAEELEFVVRPDQNPTVVIENPRRNEDRTPDATVPMQMVAEDDFGITTLKLVVDRIGDKKHWEMPLVEHTSALAGVQWNRVDSNGDLQRFRANYSWDLSALKDAQLKPGDVLEYDAVVTDNFELEGADHKVLTHAPVASGKLRLTIISHEEFDNRMNDILSGVAEQVSTLKLAQNTTQRQTSQLAKDVAGKSDMDKADRAAAERLAGQESTLASQTKSLGTKLDELQARMAENKSTNQDLKDTTKDVKDLLNNIAEQPMKNAAGDINTAEQDAPRPDDRDKDLADAQSSEGKAGDDLQKALDRMGGIGGLSRSIESVEKILAEQQKLTSDTTENGRKNLGKQVSELSAEDRKKLDDQAKAQADLSKEAEKALDQMTKDADKVAKSDPTGAKAMKDAADTGQQQNVPGNQSKAADATQNNKQSEAQGAQKNAELGLQMMLSDLKEAQKHKLDELAKKLAELQQQIDTLVRQQAGYNLDNLHLQGGDVLARVSNSVKLDLYMQAQRDPKVPLPPVELGMLSSSQEQTERNARDIAKAAQDMPDGSQPADLLTQAADKMERAIVYLRDAKLEAAYNPPQSDALTALLKAKKLIDDQKKQADKKQDDQQKESIRQAYMALLAEQNEVDARTVAIDRTPRDEDGNLPRDAQVRLGQLPGEQGQLSDKATKIGEDLKSLGSIVYDYANQDIIKNMKDVKDLLGKQKTSVVTQARQQQVVAELNAMIADLATKPEDSQFAQQSQPGGGRGGGGSSGMPTEDELRLIKDLQLAENTETIAVSKEAKQEKAEISVLGNRQGDLRALLDKLLQKASQGHSKLPPEPKQGDLLPEETDAEGKAKDPDAIAQKQDAQELEEDLLGGTKHQPGKQAAPADASKDLSVVGNRMARARQRLANNSDAGPVTQEIQKRILDNMDDLIEEARKKQAQAQNQPPQPGGEPKPDSPPKPDPGAKPQDADAKGKQQKSQAQQAGSNPGGGDGSPGEPGADIAHQEARQWGDVPPKAREAVQEGKGEIVLDKYKNLVDDYYRTMSTKANAH